MLTGSAPAKLNLYLHITGQRADGYHLLDSLVAFTEFGDKISVQKSDEISLFISGEFAEAISSDDNIVLRAAHLLRQHLGHSVGAAIHIEKCLPVGAGLGGGSADAATALHLLCRLWDTLRTPEQLAKLALPLGADLPVCLQGKPSLMSGIGEVIEPAPSLPPCHVLLVNPRRELPTAQVYGAYRHEPRDAGRPLIDGSNYQTLVQSLRAARNDLQRPAISLCAEAANILLEIETQPDCDLARLCGSGATCFGLFETESSCANAARHISTAHPDWWVRATKLQQP